MTIASDIIQNRMPDFNAYLNDGVSLDDIDEYGFTALIESVLAKNVSITKALIDLGVDINKADMAGRTALQWAVDMEHDVVCELLLKKGANPNLYTRQGFSALVYPVLRHQANYKQLLQKYGASLHFAQDFIAAKLLGHRFSLTGTVDIVSPKQQMIEVDYEGFILEFSVAVLLDSISRYVHHYAARHWRDETPLLKEIIRGLKYAYQILTYQRLIQPNRRFHQELETILAAPLVILPAASAGHAIGFIRFKNWLAKIDRGENSQKEGSVNVYEIKKPHAFNVTFLDDFIFKRQPRAFFHEGIIPILGLEKVASLPLSAQISGNCSWANLEACILVSHWMLSVYPEPNLQRQNTFLFYKAWLNWDRDRAIEEIVQALQSADKFRKASLASMLCGVLFQFLDGHSSLDSLRAEKILKAILDPKYLYILQSYLDVYAEQSRKTAHGENLKNLLDNCGYDSNQLGLSLKLRPK